MEIVSGGVEAQTEQALSNLKAVVEAGGSELGKVVKTTVSAVCLDASDLNSERAFCRSF
jgi:2-iminobutanoate/2-iminopropanoate deaminase